MANYTDKLLPKLFIALPEIGKYYALTNVLQSALDEPIVMDRDVTVDAGEADNAKLNTKDFVASFYEPDKVSALDELRGLLFSSISGGLRGADIVKLVNERLGTLDEKGNEVLKVPGLIAIQSFADGAADFADPGESYPNGVVYTGDSSIAPDKSIGFTGMCKPKDSEGQLEAEEAAEAVYDTKVYNIATPESTFSKAAADGMALTVFLNAIPTIEWSSAVPYIDVQFIQEGGNNEPAARAPSIYRFLMGENMYSSELSKASRFEEVPKSEESAGSRWMSGMEVFTSPQTMVNANERTSGNKRVGGLNDGSGVIDPFRPFMSLQDLSINIYPRVNNIIFTEGTLKLKLHDKSRIGEISGFTSPQGFGKTFIIITYGWSHPAGGSASDNPFGMFIDSMKTTEHFTVSNSSYSFTTAGEVDITLKIYSRAAGDLTTDVRILDDVCGDALDLMQQFEDLCLEAANLLPDDPAPGYPSRSISVLKPSEEAGGAYAISYKHKNIAAFKAQIKKLANTPDPDLTEVAKKMEQALLAMPDASVSIPKAWQDKLDSLASGPDPWLAGLTETIVKTDSKLKNPVKFLKSGPKKVVSVAKAISIFVGKPLQSQGRYAEVQFFYGCLNDKASFARGLSIASFPLSLDGDRNLIKALNNVAKASGYNITLGEFIGVLNNYFFENHLCPQYGFSRVSGVTVKPDKETGFLEVKYKNDKAERRSADAMSAVLKEAYDGKDWPFVMPCLTFSMKTLPIMADPGNEEPTTLDDTSNSILRVYFDDAKATPYTGVETILQSAFETHLPGAPFEEQEPLKGASESVNNIGNRVGLHNRAMTLQDAGKSITAMVELGILKEEGSRIVLPKSSGWKEILKTMAPYIDIGSSNTAVTSINMSNQSGGELQTINMLRGSMGDGPGAPTPVRLPMQMMPGKASIEFLGCPLLAPMQQYFIDMRTGTDLDNMYQVFKIAHTLAPGKFTSKAELIFASGYSRFTPLISKINRVQSKLASLKEIDPETGEEGDPLFGENEILVSDDYDENEAAISEERQRLKDAGELVGQRTWDSAVSQAEDRWEAWKKDAEDAQAHYFALCSKRGAIRRIQGDLSNCHDTAKAMVTQIAEILVDMGKFAQKEIKSWPHRRGNLGNTMLANTKLAGDSPTSDAPKYWPFLGVHQASVYYHTFGYKKDPSSWPDAVHKELSNMGADLSRGTGRRASQAMDNITPEPAPPSPAPDLNTIHGSAQWTRYLKNLSAAIELYNSFQEYISTILKGGSPEWLLLLEPASCVEQVWNVVYDWGRDSRWNPKPFAHSDQAAHVARMIGLNTSLHEVLQNCKEGGEGPSYYIAWEGVFEQVTADIPEWWPKIDSSHDSLNDGRCEHPDNWILESDPSDLTALAHAEAQSNRNNTATAAPGGDNLSYK